MNREIHVRICESVGVRLLCATRHNAPMESFFNSLKNERVFHENYQTRAEAKQDLFDYIEVFYNRRRRHSALGYCSPAQHHAAWIAEQKLAA